MEVSEPEFKSLRSVAAAPVAFSVFCLSFFTCEYLSIGMPYSFLSYIKEILKGAIHINSNLSAIDWNCFAGTEDLLAYTTGSP